MASSETSARPQAFRFCHGEAFIFLAGFILAGVLTTLLGPILPWLQFQWALTDAQSGFLFTAQFLGALLGVIATTALLPRRGYRPVLMTGFLLMAAGVSALGFGHWPVGWLFVFIYGAGLGLIIPSGNLYVAEAAGEQRAAALNYLNLAWGIGAVICPLIVSLFLKRPGMQTLFVLTGVILVCLALLCLTPGFATAPPRAESNAQVPPLWRIFPKSQSGWALAALFFLYVGTENGLGGWIATHAKRIGATPEPSWIVAPSFFWGALLLGRAVAPATLRFLSEPKVVSAGLVLASCGTAAVFVSTTLRGARAGTGIAGLGLAPVFPIFIAWLSQQYGTQAPRIGGVMFALGGCGGATLPWLVGATSSRFASLRVGLLVPLCSSLLMLAVLPAAIRFRKKISHSAQDPRPEALPGGS